jgi:hypothetical protein
MLHNRSEARRFLTLYDGGYSHKCSAQVVDGITVVDIFQAEAIVEKNAFGVPPPPKPKATSKKRNELHAVGICVMASYINHACNGNANRSFSATSWPFVQPKTLGREKRSSCPTRTQISVMDKHA